MRVRFIKYFLLISLFLISGCAYYNTFFNAKQAYKLAVKKQQSKKSATIGNAVKKDYQAAIKKCWKLIDVYSDSNKYADDALLLIGKSYYNLQDYQKAQRILEQFIKKYNQSDLLPEAKLWLARTYIGQQRDKDALALLNNMFQSKIKRSKAAEAFLILGELYFKNKDYEKAVTNIEKCLDIASDDKMYAKATYLLGEAFYKQKQYENAIVQFDKLAGLDIPAVQEYDALIKKTDALIALKKYDEAEITLKKMLRYKRFKPQYSLIENKLGQLYTEEGDLNFAADYFIDIMHKYPRSDGATLSAYHLAQLYEFNFLNFDSAKIYYDKVKNLKLYPEIIKDAKQRQALLKEYLKIRNQLRKDRRDLNRLSRGDSVLTDSVEVEGDSRSYNSAAKPKGKQLANEEPPLLPTPPNTRNNALPANSSKSDSLAKSVKKKKPPKKIEVSRNAEQVKKSFLKNSFALGEFFLLKYENTDSAFSAYKKFVHLFSDSALTPKAFYALYYIASDLKNDRAYADSVKNIILTRYPKSPYALKILHKKFGQALSKVDKKNIYYEKLYNKAEDYRDRGVYSKAIEIFNKIARQDSGSVWAPKARYFVAYIYEKDLKDIPAALIAYKTLLNEYPDSKFATIARNKTKKPVVKKKTKTEKDKTTNTSNKPAQKSNPEITKNKAHKK